jgi:N-acetylmuramoyl-L-alanine amidase
MFIPLLLVLGLLPVPFSHADPSRTSSKHIIVIDPAHGGSDGGVRLSEKLQEKEVTLLLAGMLQRELQKSDSIEVRLTREGDKDISLSSRTKIAQASHPDIFIGIHVNAGFGKYSSGYELYFPGFNLPPSSASSPAEKNESTEILMDMTKNRYLNSSVRLAQSIQRSLERVFPRKGRGLRDAPVVILDDLPVSAVVVEIGFATNADDRKKITDGNTQKALARALGNGIKDYFR